MDEEVRNAEEVLDALSGSDGPEVEPDGYTEDGIPFVYDEAGHPVLMTADGDGAAAGADDEEVEIDGYTADGTPFTYDDAGNAIRVVYDENGKARLYNETMNTGLYPEEFSVRENFGEYMIARAIERHNLRVQADPAAGTYVTVRQGRALRQQVITNLIAKLAPDGKKQGRDGLDPDKPVLAQASYEDLLDAMAKPFHRAMSDDPVWRIDDGPTGPGIARGRWMDEREAIRRDYVAVTTGREFDPEADAVLEPRTGAVNAGGREDLVGVVVPLSPYSQDLSDYSVFRSNGGRILYAPATTMMWTDAGRDAMGLGLGQGGMAGAPARLPGFLAVGDGGARNRGVGSAAQGRSDVYLMRIDNYERLDITRETDGGVAPTVRREASVTGSLNDQADASGLTLLRDYMSASEYRNAENWIRAYEDKDTHARGTVPPNMARMALAVCEELRNRGYEFTIEPDREPGQLTAKLRGSKREVRLTDLGEFGEYYVGRVYESGNSTYIVSPRRDRNTGRVDRPVYMDEKMAVANMLYGLGYPTARIGYDLYPDRKGLYGRIVDTSGEEDRFTYIGQIAHRFSSNGLSSRLSYWVVNPRNGTGWLNAWAGVATKTLDGKGVEMQIRTSSDQQATHVTFESDPAGAEGGQTGSDKAAEFIQNAIRSAKTNFSNLLDLDELFELARDAQPGDKVPALSNNPAVAALQKEYWEFLTKEDAVLKRPGADDEALSMMTEAVEAASEDYDPDDEDDEVVRGGAVEDSYYDHEALGGKENAVLRHLLDSLDYKFGSPDVRLGSDEILPADDASWKSFCPSLVSVYMRSGYGPARNKSDLVEAMRTLDFTGDEFCQKDEDGNVRVRYDDFDTLAIKDRLLKFDRESSRSLTDEASPVSPFMGTVRDSILASLRMNGCMIDDKDPDSIRIDDRGVIHYKAYMMFGSLPSPNEAQLHAAANAGRSGGHVAADYSDVRTEWIKDAYTIPVEGELGQVFEPDEDQLLETKYLGSRNKLVSPGYEAYVVMPKTGSATKENLPERYRVKNLLSVLTENISSQIRLDLQNAANFPVGFGTFRDGDRARFLNADTEEARRALMEEYGIADWGDSFLRMDTREKRESFVEAFSGNQYRWSAQMQDYVDKGGSVSAGTTTSLNYTYKRGIYTTSYKLQVPLLTVIEPDGTERPETLKEAYIRQQTVMMNYPVQALRDVFATNSRVVRFPQWLIDGSSVMDEYRHSLAGRLGADGTVISVHDLTNDNEITPWMLTGGANMAIQMENGHMILGEARQLARELTLSPDTVLAEPITVNDAVLPAGTVLSEPTAVGPEGGYLPVGSSVSSFFRVPGADMFPKVPTDKVVLANAGFRIPSGTSFGSDFTAPDGTVYPAGTPTRSAITLTAPASIPVGTVVGSKCSVKGASIPRNGAVTTAPVLLQPGTVLPAGLTLGGDMAGCSRVLPKDVPIGEVTGGQPVVLPVGTEIPAGFRMRIFEEAYTGSNKNQGAIRYMADGVGITNAVSPYGPDDPRIAGGELAGPNDAMGSGSQFVGTWDDDSRCDVVYGNKDLKNISSQPADRQQMVISNLMSGIAVMGTAYGKEDAGQGPVYKEPREQWMNDVGEQSGKDYSHGVWMVQATAGGYTFDDGCVYRDTLARDFPVLDEHGKRRAVCPGDKFCDTAGNKFTCARRYDPDMPAEERERLGLTEVFRLFEMNPDLDVVISPYSALTRFSAASAKTAMDESRPDEYKPKDLRIPDDSRPEGYRVVKGGIMAAPLIETKQTAEEHVTGYGEEDVKHGKGRKVSAQMSWALTSAGAAKMMRAIYGPDAKSLMDTREYFITLGYDIGPTGCVQDSYAPHTSAERRFVFAGPDDAMLSRGYKGEYEIEANVRKLFGDKMNDKGGFMEVPFPLRFAGKGLEMPDDPDQKGLSEVDKYLKQNKNGMYMLPVLSAHLRSGQDWQDGERRSHEYTNWYTRIYALGVEYMQLRNAAGIEPGSGEETDDMRKKREAAQRAFDSISNDIIDRRIDTKYGFARGAMMTRRMPQSATAIWTANPMLDVGEIAVSADLLTTLNVKIKTERDASGNLVPVKDGRGFMMLEGDDIDRQVLVTRDPVLDRAGVRSLKIVVVPGANGYPNPEKPGEILEGTKGKEGDQVRGVQVNPLIAATYKGDFDGDSVGLVRLNGRDVLEEQYRLFSIDQNMLDMTKKQLDADGKETGDFSLLLNVTMDVVSAEILDPELTERRENLEDALNMVARGQAVRKTDGRWEPDPEDPWAGLSAEELAAKKLEANRTLAGEVSDYTRDALVHSVGTEAVSFASLDEHMNSLKAVVQHKAKGKLANLRVYAQYFGMDVEAIEKQDPNPFVDMDAPFRDVKMLPGGRPNITDEQMRDVECATAYKAYGTGNAGAVSQMVVAFARNAELNAAQIAELSGRNPIDARLSVLDAALYVTQGATQGLLQAKHDPDKAKKFYAMINGPIPDLFRGRAMDYNEETGTWEVRYEEDSKTGKRWPAAATPEEWIAAAKAMFMDGEKGLGMDDLNPVHFEILGKAASVDNVSRKGEYLGKKIINMSRADDLISIGASPMDVCAYATPKQKGTVRFIAKMAFHGWNLFSGAVSDKTHSGGKSQLFMPEAALANERILDEADELKRRGKAKEAEEKLKELRPLMPGDVRAERSGSAKSVADLMNVREAERPMRKEPEAPAAGDPVVAEALDRAEAGFAKGASDLEMMKQVLLAQQGGKGRAGDLAETRRKIAMMSGLRDDLANDAHGMLGLSSVPASIETRDGRTELYRMEAKMKDKEAFPLDRDWNAREEATVRLAENALVDYMIDKCRTDWAFDENGDWKLDLITTRRKEHTVLTPEETARAADLIAGMRTELLRPEMRYGDDPSKLMAGETSRTGAVQEEAMKTVMANLKELYDMGYQQYMTCEVDASYGDASKGVAYEPRNSVSDSCWYADEKKEAQAGTSMMDEDAVRVEEIKAAIPTLRDDYGVFQSVMAEWQADQSDEARGRMQDMTVCMTEKLAVLYSANMGRDGTDVPFVARDDVEAPYFDEDTAGDVMMACKSLSEAVSKMYELTLGDEAKASDPGLDAERQALFVKMVSGLEMLNDCGFTGSGYAVEKPEQKAPEAEKQVLETGAPAAEDRKPEEKPVTVDRGADAESHFSGIDGSSHTEEDGKDTPDK